MKESAEDREGWVQLRALGEWGPEWARAVDALIDSHDHYARTAVMIHAGRILAQLRRVERRRDQTGAAEALLTRLARHGY